MEVVREVVRENETLNEAPKKQDKKDPHDYSVLADVVIDAAVKGLGKGMKTLLKQWEFEPSVSMQPSMTVFGSKVTVTFNTPSGKKVVTLTAKTGK